MIGNLIANARAQAQHTAGTAAIGLCAGIALCIGLAFWTAACWMFLITVTSILNATIIIAAIYTGAGLIGLAIASMRSRKTPPAPEPVRQPEPPTMDNLVAAFMSGLTAGARTRS
ncbi:phage holin family protein [Sulfitobacter sp. F26169L]|nr:phage holin family protein [Sulfitobacter sp. F26169L]